MTTPIEPSVFPNPLSNVDKIVLLNSKIPKNSMGINSAKIRHFHLAINKSKNMTIPIQLEILPHLC